MSRSRLRQALSSRDPGAGAVVPLIGRHAAALEQVSEAAFLTDPESQARALRNAQALYGTDAVTVGAGLDTLAIAVRACERPGMAAREAGGGATTGAPVGERPDQGEVLAQAPVRAELEAVRRLRPVLGERAGIALVLPSSDRLAGQLGDADAAAWCDGLVLRLVHLFGAEEPELLITVGETAPGTGLGAVCDHFGIVSVHLGAGAPDGVVALTGAAFVEAAGSEGSAGWLITTRDEIPADADPGRVREAVARWRA